MIYSAINLPLFLVELMIELPRGDLLRVKNSNTFPNPQYGTELPEPIP